MGRPKGYTTVSVHIPQELYNKLRKIFTGYGELSKALRHVLTDLVNGRLRTK